MKRYFFLYLMVFTIPLFLGLVVWQSNRYQNLEIELSRMEKTQEEWVESNKRLVAGITESSSPERIEKIAKETLNLKKIKPEYFLQVKVGGEENGL